MWELFAPIALKILGAYFQRKAERNEAYKLFVQMIAAMQKEGLASVKLGEDFEEQLRRIKMDEEKETAAKPS